MAKAPRPTKDGIDAERAQARLDKMVTVFTVRDVEYPLAVRNIPMQEKAALRLQVGMSWEQVMGLDGPANPGIDSVCAAAWLSRRAHGEPSLSWVQHCAEWDNSVTISDVSISAVDPDADSSDPEA